MAQSAYCGLLNKTMPCLKIRKLWWWMRSKQNFVWGLSVLSVKRSKVIQWPVIKLIASYHKNVTPISNFALSNQLNFYLLLLMCYSVPYNTGSPYFTFCQGWEHKTTTFFFCSWTFFHSDRILARFQLGKLLLMLKINLLRKSWPYKKGETCVQIPPPLRRCYGRRLWKLVWILACASSRVSSGIVAQKNRKIGNSGLRK